MVLLCHLKHIIGNRLGPHVLAQIVVIDVGNHVYEVDDSPEVIFFANGELNRNGIRVKPVLHHIHDTEKVCADDIHFIDIGNAGNRVLGGLTPDCFGLRLNTALCAEHRDGTVKHTKRTLNLDSKVNVTGCINYIDTVRVCLDLCGIVVKVGVHPVARCRSGGNCNTSFLLLRHPVHSGRALMSLTELMRFTRVEQDTLCCGRFTGVNMRHDPDIANPFERIFSWHRISSLLTFCVVNSFVFYLLTF